MSTALITTPRGAPEVYLNPGWRARTAFDAAAAEVTGEDIDRAAAAITAWPDYRPSPFRSLPGLARRLGIGALLCKDESARFGAGGVKALGAPYGLHRLVEARRAAVGPAIGIGDFVAVAATDGNHGLALAWAARRIGCRARILVGRDVDAGRLDRIRSAGGDIAIVDGTYDDAVLAAERLAAADPSVLLVTDTDYDGDRPVARAIMAGYALLADEAWRNGLGERPPTHVFLHCGVGTMAAGISAGLWRRLSPCTPRVVTVEPATAACVLASLKAGRPVQVEGDLRTRMAGLACGRPSRPAWNVLARAAFAGMTVDEETAIAMQRDLAAGIEGDAPLIGGDTGIAGIAGLAAAASHPHVRGRLALGPESRVFVVNSEGPSPPPRRP